MAQSNAQELINTSLVRYNTWRIGGEAERLFKPTSISDLQDYLPSCPKDSAITWLGLGSNSLVPDQGLKGTVIITQGGLGNLSLVGDQLIRAEAGVSCAKMARFSAKQGLSGAEFWAGIPGTMGGALRMNAGCFNGETWDSVVSVETINRQGEIKIRDPKSFQIAYRSVQGLMDDEWFIACTCKLPLGSTEQALATIKALLARRASTQPTSEYNCGSVFRNPPKDHAARLIEACGLKGYQLGGAMVSPKHANFIINHEGSATAQDIYQLIQHVHQTVLEQHGVNLIQEVHMLGAAHEEN